MRYRPTLNIWTLTDTERAALPIGQWVSAGEPDSARNNCGRFYGMRPSGSFVVAWNGNARTMQRDHSWKDYHKALYNFARGGR